MLLLTSKHAACGVLFPGELCQTGNSVGGLHSAADVLHHLLDAKCHRAGVDKAGWWGLLLGCWQEAVLRKGEQAEWATWMKASQARGEKGFILTALDLVPHCSHICRVAWWHWLASVQRPVSWIQSRWEDVAVLNCGKYNPFSSVLPILTSG